MNYYEVKCPTCGQSPIVTVMKREVSFYCRLCKKEWVSEMKDWVPAFLCYTCKFYEIPTSSMEMNESWGGCEKWPGYIDHLRKKKCKKYKRYFLVLDILAQQIYLLGRMIGDLHEILLHDYKSNRNAYLFHKVAYDQFEEKLKREEEKKVV